MSRRFLFLHNKNASKRRLEEQQDMTISFPDGTYTGQLMDKERHGHGTMKYKNNRHYTGQWKNDKRQGKGTLYCSSGDMYEGEFFNDKLHGKGFYKCSNGNSYIGEWKNGLRNGLGTYRYTNGNSFEGYWKDGVKHGPGIFTYSDGSRRICMFDKGVISNAADCPPLYINSNGSRAWKMIEISIDDAKRLSENIGMSYKDKPFEALALDEILNEKIVHDEVDIEEVDSCVEVTEDGVIEDMHVEAPEINQQNEVIVHPHPKNSPKSHITNNVHDETNEIKIKDSNLNHNNNKPQSKPSNNEKIKKVYPNGTYTGQVNYQDQRDGTGTMTYNHKQIYTGQWKNNKKHGQGKLTFPNKKIYTGEFQNGVKEGYGVMSYKSGAKYEGYWKNNKMSGVGKYTYEDGNMDYCHFLEGKAIGIGVRFNSDLSRVYKTVNDKCVGEIKFEEAKVLMEEMGFPIT